MRIIYFDIDTLRLDHLGCYGYHRNTSHNIDPFWTVTEECGPHHKREMLNTYIRRLRRSGREEFVKVIQESKESE